MTAPKTLPFAGTPAELEKYLLEFARLTGGIAGRQPKASWIVRGGAFLSTNPNTVPWAIANASFEKQQRNRGVTEIVEMPNRGHALVIDSGWREVADTALSFVRRFV